MNSFSKYTLKEATESICNFFKDKRQVYLIKTEGWINGDWRGYEFIEGEPWQFKNPEQLEQWDLYQEWCNTTWPEVPDGFSNCLDIVCKSISLGGDEVIALIFEHGKFTTQRLRIKLKLY